MIKGRYSSRPVPFKSENMRVEHKEGTIRLDDAENLDFWMELTLEGKLGVFGEVPIGSLVCFADGQLCYKVSSTEMESVYQKQKVTVSFLLSSDCLLCLR